MIKLIIFDWDDVFSQGSIEGYKACYHAAIQGVGFGLDPEEEDRRIKLQWGKSYREEIIELLQEKPELVDQACEIFEQQFFGDTFISTLKGTPGSAQLVTRLSRHYALAIVSGAHPKMLERSFRMFRIPNVFEMIVTAYDLNDPKKAKPHPYSAQTIMSKLGIESGETIMVGDAENDVLMARAANIEPVVVLTGHLTQAEAEKLQVKYIIEDVTKLESVLAKL